MYVHNSARRAVCAWSIFIVMALSAVRVARPADESSYRSPYRVEFTCCETELIGDILDGKRGDVLSESSLRFDEWMSSSTRKQWGSWGPPARRFAPPEGAQALDGKSAQWKRERVIAVALRYAGLHYQHHHIPDFDPPADWPHNAEEKSPKPQTKGLDCSNYTAWVYNLALGIKFGGDIHKQSELQTVNGPGEGAVTKLIRIDRPASYEEFLKIMRPGDLLFMKNRKDEVSHVVLWVGLERIGSSAGEATSIPLVLDSTGEGHRDKNGLPIPDGIYLRPFRADTWYFHSASHALRLIPDDSAQ